MGAPYVRVAVVGVNLDGGHQHLVGLHVVLLHHECHAGQDDGRRARARWGAALHRCALTRLCAASSAVSRSRCFNARARHPGTYPVRWSMLVSRGAADRTRESSVQMRSSLISARHSIVRTPCLPHRTSCMNTGSAVMWLFCSIAASLSPPETEVVVEEGRRAACHASAQTR